MVTHYERLEEFFDSKTVFDTVGVVTKKRLYEAYLEWCNEKGYISLTKSHFFRLLPQFIEVRSVQVGPRGNRVRAFRGIRLS